VIFLLLVGSTKTNLVFVFVFFTLDIGVFLLVGAFFKVASGQDVLAGHLQKVSSDTDALTLGGRIIPFCNHIWGTLFACCHHVGGTWV